MPFRKFTTFKGKQLVVAVMLALAIYLVPQICQASCPMMAPAAEKCCCDKEDTSVSSDKITAPSCCSIKQAPAKDEAIVSVKPVQVSLPVVPFHTITLSGLSSQIFATSELPTPVARLALQSPVLRI